MIPSSGIQLDLPKIGKVYRRFAALAAVSANAGGLLLLYGDLDAEGIATVIAANMAGVASLGLEQDAALAKQALRTGICDFVVNSLDEGLRILKNEVRQHRAASVVVTEEAKMALVEIVSRGVQPDIVAIAVPDLIERGAKVLPAFSSDMTDGMQVVTWSVQREPMRWLPMLDALATKAFSEEAALSWRVRWLEASPRYLGRMFAGQRYAQMAAAEAARFVAAVEAAVKAGEVQVAVQVMRDGQTLLIES